jgi:putative molybdopterin biosynthesis protein
MLMQEQVFSIVEAASVLKVHKDTIRRMIKRGELQANTVGRQYRIRQSEIDRLLGKQIQ